MSHVRSPGEQIGGDLSRLRCASRQRKQLLLELRQTNESVGPGMRKVWGEPGHSAEYKRVSGTIGIKEKQNHGSFNGGVLVVFHLAVYV